MNYRGAGYGGYEDSPYYNDGDRIVDSVFGDAPGEKVVRGDCHIGTLLYQHNVNLDVFRSSSVETDLQLSLDESNCIACIRVQSRGRMKSNVSIGTTNGSSGGQNTVKLMAMGSRYEYYEHLQLTLEVFVVKKRGRRCDPI